MAIGDSIQRYPLLRLLIPYACGIGLSDAVYQHIGSLLSGILCATVLVWGVLCVLHVSKRRLLQWAYGGLVTLLFFLLGISCYLLERDKTNCEWPSQSVAYEACVIESPHQRARSVLCELEICAVSDSSVLHAVRHKVFAYMEPCPAVDSLLPGDRICFEGRVRAPRSFSEDLPFDYARYVHMQGASGTIYLPVGKWIRVDGYKGTLRVRMLRLRHRLVAGYLQPMFDGDVFGVLSALTLGDKHALSDEVRSAYAESGAAHVLALSGLHVGVIYGIILFVVQVLFRRRSTRWLRELLTITVLWLFALLAGMSASVVRAVFMCSLYVVARWVSRDSSAINTLSLAALVMLLLHPLYLFDVGFQLSFMAMASILLVEPHFEALFRRRSLPGIAAYFVGIVCMSLAAQLGTFPLVLYHFGAFPTYFLLTNLLVIPILPVVLSLAIVWWVLTLSGLTPISMPIADLLQFLVRWLNAALDAIAHWPGAVLHVAGFRLPAVVFLYLFMLFVVLFITRKWSRGLVYALASLLGLFLSLLP